MGFLRPQRPWGFSHEARRGPQGASRAAPGKSGLHARGEGEGKLGVALESPQGRRDLTSPFFDWVVYFSGIELQELLVYF